MYERKEKLKEEGLFITEFNDVFFESCLKEGKEIEKIVQEIEDLSKEYKKEYEEECKKNRKEVKDVTWQFIMKAALTKFKELRPKIKFDLNDFSLDAAWKYMISEFYSNSLFLEFDIAQKIEYNLYRCAKEEHEIYNLVGIKKGTENDFETMWKKYGKELFFSGRKMEKMEEIDNYIYFPTALQRLQAPKSRVCFSGGLKDDNLLLESGFSALNFLYLGNEKFQNYLKHETKSKNYFDELLKYIQILNEKCDVPLNYVWEKMTNFNLANIISKFIVKFISQENLNIKKGTDFIKMISEGNDTFLNQITNMPNVLTRLIFLKKVFLTILRDYRNSTLSDISAGVLCNLRDALKSINDQYRLMQGVILELTVVTYWKMSREQGKEPDIEKWIQQIEKEYSLDGFRKMLAVSSLEDQFLRVKTIHAGPPNDKKLWKYFRECDFIHYESVGIRDIIQCLGDKIYFEDANDLAKVIKKKDWITTESYYEVEAKEDWYNKYQYNEICFTEIYNEDREKKRYNKLKAINTVEHIENVLKSYLLSAYDDVIFENTNMQNGKGYIENMNFLLYYMK